MTRNLNMILFAAALAGFALGNIQSAHAQAFLGCTDPTNTGEGYAKRGGTGNSQMVARFSARAAKGESEEDAKSKAVEGLDACESHCEEIGITYSTPVLLDYYFRPSGDDTGTDHDDEFEIACLDEEYWFPADCAAMPTDSDVDYWAFGHFFSEVTATRHCRPPRP